MKIVSVVSILLCFSCQQENIGTVAPPTLQDGWETATLAQANIDEAKILEGVEKIRANEYTDIHSMLIIRNNKLVFEEYFNGFTRNDFHVLFSATKSYSSTLIGIAIDKGYIASSEVPVKDLLSSKAAFFTSGKESMTLADILSMSSGLHWDEWSTSGISPENSHEKMMLAPSQIDYVLSLPLADSPGTHFTYNTGTSNLLAPILEHSTGIAIEEFAIENLFAPLAITSYRWETVIDEYPSTGGSRGGLEMVPRDMAKLGQLYLDKGKWHDTQVVSEAWVAMATQAHINQSTAVDYGYQWWSRSYFKKDGKVLAEFDAVGDGGQWVFVFPELELVVAFTGGNYTWEKGGDLMFQPIALVQKHILPGVN